jgi:hypothetical protein
MTYESGLPGWLASAKRKEAVTTTKRPSRRHRPHAGLILELALMLVLAALLPRDKNRK